MAAALPDRIALNALELELEGGRRDLALATPARHSSSTLPIFSRQPASRGRRVDGGGISEFQGKRPRSAWLSMNFWFSERMEILEVSS